jgi:predicted amidophosphoribosyltransferase
MTTNDIPESVRRADAGQGALCGQCGRAARLLHGKDHLCSRCFNAGKPRRAHVSPGSTPTKAMEKAAEDAITAERMRRALTRKPRKVKIPGMR